MASTDPVTGTMSETSSAASDPTSTEGGYPTLAPPPYSTSSLYTTASTDPATGSVPPSTTSYSAEDPSSTSPGGSEGGGYPSSICYKGYGTESICFPVPAAPTDKEGVAGPAASNSEAVSSPIGSMTTFVRANVVVPTPAAEVETQAEAADDEDKSSGWGWFQGWGRREAQAAA